MKKNIIFTAFLVLAFSSALFASWKSWEDFNKYKDARKVAVEAENAGDTTTAVANYKKAAELAGKSGTKDIQAWQINNAAFVLIKQFKNLVAYDEKLAKLNEMKPSAEKIAFQKDVAGLFSLKLDMLNEAKELLESGKAVEAGETPAAKIQSNLEFIEWVQKFVADNSGDAPAAEAPAAKTEEKAK
ncbi:MAG: hypothetical protein LLG37_02615 [Spirochaetia bacterium]|nr:hypothetical protein [Spirochaetia bacterium]